MKILVVDDSHFNLSLTKRYLEDMSAITQILLCDDPRQVTDILDQYEIDILITDLMMPAITGFELLAKLRADKKYDDMPIIMLTSIDDMTTYKKCFDLGAFDYINKPINTVELHSRLKVAIEAKNSSNHLKSLLEVTRKQNEELREINAKLTEAKFSLVQSEKMAAIGQLAAGIAHEINNPMGYISSNFDVLQGYFLRIREFFGYLNTSHFIGDTSENNLIVSSAFDILEKYHSLKISSVLEDLDSLFSDTLNGIQRITDIVQSLRVYARSSKDDEKSAVKLLDLFRQIILITNNEVKYTSRIDLDVPDDITIYCNRIQIGQVFVNIIVNAAQAIKSQNRLSLGTININAEKNGQDIIIAISDDGPGIPEEHLIKVFEPFFTTKEIGKGTGLGLSISYDIIVNKHKGHIDVKSEFGNGATFIIKLPVVTD